MDMKHTKQLVIRVFEIAEDGTQEEIARGTISENGTKFRELREGGETYLSPSIYNGDRSKFAWHVLAQALQNSKVGRCLKRSWRWVA